MDKNLNAFEKTLGRKKKAEDFVKWRKWVSEHDNKSQEKLNEEIDVLIATDCLSEGQNLQDCDFVVNYDIHWNPVRLIQRIGRIDRIGSPNKSFQVVNFWPTDNINKYLDLEDRIVDRLVAARLAGTEFNKDLIKSLTKKMVDDNTEEQQKRKLLLQMEQSVEELEDSKSFGFSDLSLDTFRQDLLAKQRADPNKLDAIPKGSFSGFIAKNKDICPKDGVIALLGFPARKKLKSNHAFKSFKLIYLDKNSQLVNDSQIQTLTALSTHIKEPRNVPDALDKRDPSEIAKYQKILVDYFTNISSEGTPEQRHEGQKTNKALKEGKKEILEAAKQEGGLDAMHDMENHELLAWMIIQ